MIRGPATEWAMRNRGVPGTYVLVVSLPHDGEIVVGALGRLSFEAGYYLYVGSALGGLGARIGRHLRTRKRLRWHIDYLLACGSVRDIWYRASPDRQECIWARALARLPGAEPVAVGFGASDCSCRTHLFYSRVRPDLASFRALLPGQPRVERIRVQGPWRAASKGP